MLFAATQAAGRVPLQLLRVYSAAAAVPTTQPSPRFTETTAGAHHWQCQPCLSLLYGRRKACRSRLVSAQAAAAEPAIESAPSAGIPADNPPHVSVLLNEVLAAFEGREVRRYVDGTLGAAGHAVAVLNQHPELQALVGFDLDPTAHQLASTRLEAAGARIVPVVVSRSGQATYEAVGGSLNGVERNASSSSGSGPTAFLVRSNFGRLKEVLQQLPLGCASSAANDSTVGSAEGAKESNGGVDAILLDLGISSMQVDTAERGFSFLREGPLDMRMDPGAVLSAEQAVNRWSEAELGRVIREYGEERHWRAIARRIVAAREAEPITTTQQLVRAIGNVGGSGGGRGRGKRGSGGEPKYKHPATRTFQALRIAVNGELQSVAQVLPDAIDCLSPGGRLAVITFHSLEDRIVKWAFRRAAGMAPSDEQLPSYCLPFEQPEVAATVRILTRRPTVPSEEEQAANVRSRSAKLRVVEKL